METLKINILNPKVKRILKNLAELDLIKIEKSAPNNFFDLVERLRAKKSTLTFEEITKEVEAVRKESQVD